MGEYVTGMISPWCEFHPWVEFTPFSGQTYLSVYMFNQGEISPPPVFRHCLEDRGETHPGGNSAWFKRATLNFISPHLNKHILYWLVVTRVQLCWTFVCVLSSSFYYSERFMNVKRFEKWDSRSRNQVLSKRKLLESKGILIIYA